MSKLDRLEKAINAAAERLPDAWEIVIQVEQGYAGITLQDPYGDDVPDDDVYNIDDSLAEQIENAIAYAISHDDEYCDGLIPEDDES